MSYETRRDDGKHLETGSEARQASVGRPVLYVLIGGLILAAIYLIGTQIWSATEEDSEAPGALVEEEANPGGAAPPAVQPNLDPAPAG